MDGGWKNWTCLGGDQAGVPCTPGSAECGPRSQCTTAPETAVACITYQNAPPQIFDASEIFAMGRIDAFTSKEVCNTYTIPQHARLLTLSTHTHRRGKRFRVWYPPNDVCQPGPDCNPADREHDYINRDYADPLYQRFAEPDLPAYDSPDPRDRTFRYVVQR
jgi:hypothetical protein